MIFSYPVCSAKIYSIFTKKKNFFLKKKPAQEVDWLPAFSTREKSKKLFKKFKIEIIIHEINFDIISKKKSCMWFIVAKKR